jgi:hypothetical protein
MRDVMIYGSIPYPGSMSDGELRDAFDRWLAGVKAEAAEAERGRLYAEVRGIPAWGAVAETHPGGFDCGINPRAVVLTVLRTSANAHPETEPK